MEIADRTLYSRSGVEVWARGPLANGDYAVALVNKNDAAMDVTLKPKDLSEILFVAHGPIEAFRIFDIFAEAELGVVTRDGSWCFTLVEPHGTKFLRLVPVPRPTGAASSRACRPHPPAPPGPPTGPSPPFSPPCPAPTPPPAPPPTPGSNGWIGPFGRTCRLR